MGLLSVDSLALLTGTAPGVLPFQSKGIPTSTISAGGVVRTRSLIAVDEHRGRGVARATDVLSKDGDDGPFAAYGQAEAYAWDHGRGAMASSAPAHRDRDRAHRTHDHVDGDGARISWDTLAASPILSGAVLCGGMSKSSDVGIGIESTSTSPVLTAAGGKRFGYGVGKVWDHDHDDYDYDPALAASFERWWLDAPPGGRKETTRRRREGESSPKACLARKSIQTRVARELDSALDFVTVLFFLLTDCCD
jgi:hypothetical protein